MIPKRGVHRPLEEAANELLRRSLAGVTSHKAKSDILTPWKEGDRRRREVYVRSGTPDAAIRLGQFHRVINTSLPHLNSREGIAPPRRADGRHGSIGGSLGSFVDRYHDSDD